MLWKTGWSRELNIYPRRQSGRVCLLFWPWKKLNKSLIIGEKQHKNWRHGENSAHGKPTSPAPTNSITVKKHFTLMIKIKLQKKNGFIKIMAKMTAPRHPRDFHGQLNCFEQNNVSLASQKPNFGSKNVCGDLSTARPLLKLVLIYCLFYAIKMKFLKKMIWLLLPMSNI